MREEFLEFENNIPIHISEATVPVPDNKRPRTHDHVISDMHLHNEYELIKIVRGSLSYITPNKKYDLNEGDVMFINKYIPHSTFTDIKTTYILIQFRLPSDGDSIIRYISRFINISDTSEFLFKNSSAESEEILNCIDSIIDEYTKKDVFWTDYVYSDMLKIVASLRRQGIITEARRKHFEEINKIRPALEYINDNYEKNISTLDLSRMMNFNETYFCRLFKSIVGTSAINYINFVRVCKAEKLLKKNLSLLEIANRTGFSSLSYFNRVFKKYKNYSPGEYKKIINTHEYEL